MRISAKAEYACFAMLDLAASHLEGQPVRVKAIADAQGIPQRFLVQILLQLKAAGLVVSSRGAAGGYQLARSPEEISLAETINAIDRSPPFRPAPVSRPESPFVRTVRGVWQEIYDEQQRLLSEMTLADLVRRSRENSSLSYEI